MKEEVTEHVFVADLDLLLKLRVIVARVGEMDLAGWWNTKGQLGSLGASVLRRGFPRTHHFVQARSVFAVAAHRVTEIYDFRDSVTLWRLPAALEDEFDRRWEQWLEDASDWAPFFRQLNSCEGDLVAELQRFDLVSDEQVDRASKLRRSAERRAVQIPGEFRGSQDDFAMLALGFSRGETGNLAVPYQAWAAQ